MMKRFGKRRIGKLINTLIALAVFLWSLFLLGQNMIIFSFLSFFSPFYFSKDSNFCLT